MNEWYKSFPNLYKLDVELGDKYINRIYKACINRCGNGFELAVNLKKRKTGFYLFDIDAYCKTVKQAMQLEAQIRLVIMEAYL